MNAKQNDQLSKEIIFCKQAFSLVRIEWLEIFWHYKFLLPALLDVVSFKHRILQEVRVRDIIKYCITQNFHLLKMTIKIVALFKSAVCKCVK